MKFSSYNKTYYEKIKLIILDKINIFLNHLLDPKFDLNVQYDDKIMLDSQIKKLYQLFDEGMLAGSVSNDMYILSRILKSDEFKNCIIYVGKVHYYTIKECLLATDFNIVNENESDENEFRCLKNITLFNDFFFK